MTAISNRVVPIVSIKEYLSKNLEGKLIRRYTWFESHDLFCKS